MGYAKEQAKAEIEKLVEDFKRNKSRLQNQAEAQIENNFIRPLFKYLNWNTSNEGLAVADYEFIVNRTGRGGKRPDYTLQLDGQHLLVMDAKQVKYSMQDPRWLNQVYAYGYSTQNLAPTRRIDFAVLTDFEEFVVLDCTLHVNDPRALRNFLVLNWTCDDFVKQFDRLWDLFERENMRRTARIRHSDTPLGLWALALSPRKVKANRTPPDKAFLADMDNDKNGWRVHLAKDMKKLNPTADGALITAAVQLLIDRLIFIKALSDREIEDDYLDQLAATIESDGLAESDNGWFAACSKIFDKLNRFYNGNIFKPRPELEAVVVTNKTVHDIIRSLQPENSPYNFAVLPVEILGTIYERFLGRVVRTTEQRVKIEEKPEVRKAGGVYYTPQYIVEYIVKNTVGKLLEGCRTPAEAAKLKILDPACGSGSFLVGAYAFLIDWHIKYFDTKKRLSAADRADAYYDSDGRVRLTARLKRQILINNLFGVDIDQQAVEVSRFSLSLKALEDTRREELYEERTLFKETVLPDLNNNIKCGNSLIGPDYFSGKMFPDSEELRRVNPFDWQREFPAIFSSGGFDAVIGNPPYGAFFSESEKDFIRKKYESYNYKFDSYIYFIEKSLEIVSSSGFVSFITPEVWLKLESSTPLRKLISERSGLLHLKICGENVFENTVVNTIIFLLQRGKNPEKLFLEMENENWETDSINWKRAKNYSIDYRIKSNTSGLIEKISLKSKQLSNFGEVIQGITAYDKYRGQDQELIKKRGYHANLKINESYEKWLNGKDISRYALNWSGEWISYGPWLAAPRDPRFFSGQRLLFREIPGKNKRIQAAFVESDKYFHGHSVTPFKAYTNCLVDLLYILGLVNSRLLSWQGSLTLPNFGKDIFPKLNPQDINCLPIRDINFSNKKDKNLYDQMVQLVKSILSLYKHQAVAMTQTEQEMIQRQIDATDREIDSLVYELYGLTKEEIAIIENT